MALSYLDWGIVAAYLTCIIWVGIRLMRGVSSAGGFFLGNRKLKSPMMIASSFAGGINANQPVSVAANTYVNGLSGMWLSLAFIVATPFFWIWPPVLRRLRIVTIIDLFRMRYGRTMEWIAILSHITVAPFVFGVGIKAAATLIMAVGGADANGQALIGYHTAIMMVVIPTVFYTLLGGVVAAYTVDMFQSVLIIVLSFVVLPFIVWHVGSMTEVSARIAAVNPNAWNLLGGSEGIPGIWLFWFAIGCLLSAAKTFGGSSGAACDEMAARWQVIGSLGKRFCTVGWGLAGLFAIALLGAPSASGHKPEDVFAISCITVLPEGLRGVIVAAMLAAVMSSLAGMMLNIGAALVNNLYKDYIYRDASPRHYLIMARVFTGFPVALGWVVASSKLGLIHLVIITEQINGVLGLSILAAFVWRRVTAAGAIAATVIMTPLFYWGNRLPASWPDWYALIADRVIDAYAFVGINPHVDLSMPADLSPEHLIQITTPIYICLGLVTLVLVSLLSKQHDSHAVAQFYARVETPLGDESSLRAAGFQADTLEDLDRREVNADVKKRPSTRRLLMLDLFDWPWMLASGRARWSDYWVDFAGIIGSVVIVFAFLWAIQLFARFVV